MNILDKIDRILNEEKYILTIVTKEKAEKSKDKYKNANKLGYHIRCNNKGDAENKKEKFEKEGKYKGETIQKMLITRESEGMGQDNN